MGDAGFHEGPPPSQDSEETTPTFPSRDIHVLVTGFGSFKAFKINPSFLIASSLPSKLTPLPAQSQTSPIDQPPSASGTPLPPGFTPAPSDPPLRPADPRPYTIHVHVYPEPVHVAYASTSVLIPSLLNPSTNAGRIDYDYVFHIGLASGRDSYTLETIAHRDTYTIRDEEDSRGELAGEAIWKRLTPPVPTSLEVGWNSKDVLSRWTEAVSAAEKLRDDPPVTQQELDDLAEAEEQERQNVWRKEMGLLLIRKKTGGRFPKKPIPKAVCKLSRDAGRFLCEFILMCSLICRYRHGLGHDKHEHLSPTSVTDPSNAGGDAHAHCNHNIPADDGFLSDLADYRKQKQLQEKIGKVAFLHVPNGTEKVDIERGRIVAESAIRSIVASWEAGYRNSNVYTADGVKEMSSMADEEMEKAAKSATTTGGLFKDNSWLSTFVSRTTTTNSSARDSSSDGFERQGTGDA